MIWSLVGIAAMLGLGLVGLEGRFKTIGRLALENKARLTEIDRRLRALEAERDQFP